MRVIAATAILLWMPQAVHAESVFLRVFLDEQAKLPSHVRSTRARGDHGLYFEIAAGASPLIHFIAIAPRVAGQCGYCGHPPGEVLALRCDVDCDGTCLVALRHYVKAIDPSFAHLGLDWHSKSGKKPSHELLGSIEGSGPLFLISCPPL